VLLVGLAVGVDYSMFYLRREREERAAGRSERAALEAAAATSGRSVLISGLTVMVALAGMFLTGDGTFESFAYATMMVVAIADLEQRALASGRVHKPITIDTNRERTISNITVPIAGTGTDAGSNASLALLRDTIVPATVGALPNTQAGVTGLTAEWKDQQDQMKSKLPLVVGFVLLFAFLLMLVAFRSIVIAFKAIVLNLLSVAAAYGVLVLVFQHGFGKGLLGFSSTAGISPVVPLLLFVILFGLSMDYHVFIV